MKFVPTLTEPHRRRLAQVHKTACTHRERQRAHAMLLSAKGYTLDQLADIFEVDRDTVSRWLEAWHTYGFGGLADDPKSGRPAKLDLLRGRFWRLAACARCSAIGGRARPSFQRGEPQETGMCSLWRITVGAQRIWILLSALSWS